MRITDALPVQWKRAGITDCLNKMSTSTPYIKVKQLKDLQATSPPQSHSIKNLMLMEGYKVKLTCKVCGEIYFGSSTEPAAREFARVHQDPHRHKCPRCPKKYLEQKYLITHLADWHKEESLFCDNCSYIGREKIYLIKHMKKKHPELVDEEPQGNKYKDMKQLRNRKVVVYQDLLPGDENKNLKQLRNRDVVVREKKAETFLCQFCGYEAQDKSKLKDHEGKFHKKVKYPCKKCTKVCLTQEGLKQHMEHHKLPPKTHTCDKCGKNFSGAWKLKKHLMSHDGVKPQQCTICERRFSSRSSLRQHLLTHTGKRPYSCDICGKTFVQKPALTGHRRQHPGELPPLPKVYIDSFIKEVAPSAVRPSSNKAIDMDSTFEDFNVEH